MLRPAKKDDLCRGPYPLRFQGRRLPCRPGKLWEAPGDRGHDAGSGASSTGLPYKLIDIFLFFHGLLTMKGF